MIKSKIKLKILEYLQARPGRHIKGEVIDYVSRFVLNYHETIGRVCRHLSSENEWNGNPPVISEEIEGKVYYRANPDWIPKEKYKPEYIKQFEIEQSVNSLF